MVRQPRPDQVQSERICTAGCNVPQQSVRAEETEQIAPRVPLHRSRAGFHVVAAPDVVIPGCAQPGAFPSADEPHGCQLVVYNVIQPTQPLDRFAIDHTAGPRRRQGQLFHPDLDGLGLPDRRLPHPDGCAGSIAGHKLKPISAIRVANHVRQAYPAFLASLSIVPAVVGPASSRARNRLIPGLWLRTRFVAFVAGTNGKTGSPVVVGGAPRRPALARAFRLRQPRQDQFNGRHRTPPSLPAESSLQTCRSDTFSISAGARGFYRPKGQ